MVAWQNGQVVAVPLTEVLARSPLPVDANGYLVQTARSLGIYVGDVSTQSTGGITTLKFVKKYHEEKTAQ